MATVNFCLPFFLDTVSFLFLSRAKLAACYLVFAFPRLSLLPQKERYFLLINLSIKVDTKMTQWGKMFFWNRILIFLHIDNFMKYVLKHSNICAMIKVRGRYISWNCSRIIIRKWFQKIFDSIGNQITNLRRRKNRWHKVRLFLGRGCTINFMVMLCYD